jgi:hypothetical protein
MQLDDTSKPDARRCATFGIRCWAGDTAPPPSGAARLSPAQRERASPPREPRHRMAVEALPAAAQVTEVPLPLTRTQDARARALPPAQCEVLARPALRRERVVLVQTELELAQGEDHLAQGAVTDLADFVLGIDVVVTRVQGMNCMYVVPRSSRRKRYTSTGCRAFVRLTVVSVLNGTLCRLRSCAAAKTRSKVGEPPLVAVVEAPLVGRLSLRGGRAADDGRSEVPLAGHIRVITCVVE